MADPSYMKLYESECEAFQDRIRKRSKQKLDIAMEEYNKEEKEKRIQMAPGGLDPQDVYDALPDEMRTAFDSQQVSQLQDVALKMDKEVFAYHLQRCIDSGLWVPDGNQPKSAGGDNEGQNEDEEQFDEPDQVENAGDASETPEPKKDR